MIYVITPGYQREANALAVAVGLPVTAVNHDGPGPVQRPHPGRRAHHREPGLDHRP